MLHYQLLPILQPSPSYTKTQTHITATGQNPARAGYNYRAFPESTVHLRIKCSTQPALCLSLLRQPRENLISEEQRLCSLNKRWHRDNDILQTSHSDLVQYHSKGPPVHPSNIFRIVYSQTDHKYLKIYSDQRKRLGLFSAALPTLPQHSACVSCPWGI